MPRTARFGVEEEFVLLDAATLVPVSAEQMHAAVLGELPSGGRLSAEFMTSQIEAATEPVPTLASAQEQLTRMRAVLARHAPAGTLVAATGAPFALAGPGRITSSPHYDDVADLIGHLAAEHVVDGLHVHVEVADDEERVRALRRLREWLPLLLALSVNSPFANGVAAGLASWRSTLLRRLPVSWGPPAFADADDYHRTVDRLLAIGALPARSSVSWAVRLSDRYDTVETRVADAQLSVTDSLLLAALTRALVLSDEVVKTPAAPHALDASLWLASRHGMRARLSTQEGGSERAWPLVERMLRGIRPVLDELGDAEFVDDQLARMRTEGTGAERQLRAHGTRGVEGLTDVVSVH
ncbi:YbdK family carboxylate-amine ligase [Microbacterium sp. ARD32]|uniref:carboxylate-amine ligase n=1 Tax=Microbacterium sp. ARD32 TaxID=2962577 RepID=UPI0028813B63|nr:YbdK family carboxylate-amine ligase [Microbacterium sp. ARD32]MDT0157774.1 YbdK family carboxylate-amine ligase [Microbacterium sp. ARD32]